MNEPDNYIPYPSPRLGLFSVGFGYDENLNCIDKQEEFLIIGEESFLYVEQIKKANWGVWVGDNVIPCTDTIYLGVHKTRLIKWLPTQTTLF